MEMPPAPLECHPYYRDKTWLIDWLNGSRDYPGDRVELADVSEDWYTSPSATVSQITITKRKAFGVAPYVGRPFVYVWYVGTDQYGRSVAGDSRIVYTEPDYE